MLPAPKHRVQPPDAEANRAIMAVMMDALWTLTGYIANLCVFFAVQKKLLPSSSTMGKLPRHCLTDTIFLSLSLAILSAGQHRRR